MILQGTAFSQKKVESGSRYLERAVNEARLANDLGDDDRAAIEGSLHGAGRRSSTATSR